MEVSSEKKLNIAIICDSVTDCLAGSFVSTLRFAELLAKKGHKIIFISSKSPQSRSDGYYKGIKVYRFFSLLLPKSEGQLYLAFVSPARIKKILKEEKINVLHAVIPTPLTVVSLRAAKALGIKAIAHSHTQPENLFMHLPKIIRLEKINSLFYKYLFWIYKQADTVIYPTEFARQIFASRKERIVLKTAVVSNGVNTDEYKKTDTKIFFEKFKLKNGTKNILFVGRLHPEKSVATLIKAVPLIIKKISESRVFIVGFGHMENELKKLAADLGVAEKIIFFGKLSDEDKIMALNAGDIFVMPSLAELEGMAVLEAMACGMPIIIANSKGSASVYFVGQNGFLFEPENPEDLAAKAVAILSDKEKLENMGKESLIKSKQYDINESVKKLEEIYFSVRKE